MLNKNQYCELCRRDVEDVEPARLRGKPIIMVCKTCLSAFPGRVKANWGREQYQYFWDLRSSLVPLSNGLRGTHEFEIRLSGKQVVQLRAAGYLLRRCKDVDGDSEVGEVDEANGSVCS